MQTGVVLQEENFDSSSCVAETFEFLAVHLSKNFTNNFPSLSQKMPVMTLTEEICALNFFSCVVTIDQITPLIVFSSLGRKDQPRFYRRYLFSVLLTALEKFCADVLTVVLRSAARSFVTHLAETFP